MAIDERIAHILKSGDVVTYMELKEKLLQQRDIERQKAAKKYCQRCKKTKHHSKFSIHDTVCDKCTAVRLEQQVENELNRKQYHKDYGKTEIGAQIKWAKQVVYAMKKMGVLKQGVCETCSTEKTQAHHKDYNKPFEVMWLCKKHHTEWHKNNEVIYVKRGS